MPKKGMTIQVDQPAEKGSLPTEPEAAEKKDLRLLNAEEVTKMAIDFLESLGNEQPIPIKVVQEGIGHYIVRFNLKKKKNATIVVDANAKEITEYEINEARKMPTTATTSSDLSPKIILIICVMHILLTILVNVLKNYLPIPFPFL